MGCSGVWAPLYAGRYRSMLTFRLHPNVPCLAYTLRGGTNTPCPTCGSWLQARSGAANAGPGLPGCHRVALSQACCVALLCVLQVIDASGGVSWEDIAGLETAKNLIKEIVVWPMMNPELFTVGAGLRV